MEAIDRYNQAFDERYKVHADAAKQKLDLASRKEFVALGIESLGIKLQDFNGKKALDISEGAYSELLKQGNAEVVSVDTLAVGEKSEGDGSLPFGDQEFDVVTIGMLFSVSRNPFTLVKEIVRVLKPSGLVIIDDLVVEPMSYGIIRSLVASNLLEKKDATKLAEDAKLPLKKESDKFVRGEVRPEYINWLFEASGIESKFYSALLKPPEGVKAHTHFFMKITN